jgi:hypothetical protein
MGTLFCSINLQKEIVKKNYITHKMEMVDKFVIIS